MAIDNQQQDETECLGTAPEEGRETGASEQLLGLGRSRYGRRGLRCKHKSGSIDEAEEPDRMCFLYVASCSLIVDSSMLSRRLLSSIRIDRRKPR